MDIKIISKHVGGIVAMANLIGVTKGAVSQWDPVPVDRVLAVAEATGWQVTPHEIRPDIYPHPQDGLPDVMRCKEAA